MFNYLTFITVAPFIQLHIFSMHPFYIFRIFLFFFSFCLFCFFYFLFLLYTCFPMSFVLVSVTQNGRKTGTANQRRLFFIIISTDQ